MLPVANGEPCPLKADKLLPGTTLVEPNTLGPELANAEKPDEGLLLKADDVVAVCPNEGLPKDGCPKAGWEKADFPNADVPPPKADVLFPNADEVPAPVNGEGLVGAVLKAEGVDPEVPNGEVPELLPNADA